MQVAVDTGGTFTDVVAADGRSTKVLSTPDDPAAAVATGVRALLGGSRPDLLAHGTTVATNALLERRGARVALVTSPGMRDVVEIARQDRPSLYDAFADRPEPLVPREWRYELPGTGAGTTAGGAPAVPTEGDVAAIDPDPAVEVVAVCLLHADVDPAGERAVGAALRHRGWEVTCSHEVSPEMREYERTVTTVMSASLRPRTRAYLRRLDGLAGEVHVMTSAGGLLPAGQAAERPAALLLSGPAGGVRAGAAAAVANGYPDAVTLDMGGTSTDVCLIRDGAPAPAAEREVGGFTVRHPSLDVHTIGAGGGSIARVDPGGALVVGPESAGADPGPACYGRGGSWPTVTDADLVAGRIPPASSFGGLDLDAGAAGAALERAGVPAEGVLAVVDATMERAVRAVSVERGVDPRDLALVAFGGAGPLHACALAEALDMAAVIVPGRAGVASAVGLLTAPRRWDLVRSWPQPGDHTGLAAARRELAAEACQLAGGRGNLPGGRGNLPGGEVGAGAAGVEPTVTTAVDCRYRGQSHELAVPSVEAFHAEHQRRNGYQRPEQPVEVVALRAGATLPAQVDPADLPVPERAGGGPVDGPRVLAEPDCTVWIPDGWTAVPGAAGALVLRRRGSGEDRP